MDLAKKYTATTKTIAERLENLEKCCEDSKKIKLESEKKIASLEKTCEEYKKNIFYLMTLDNNPSVGRTVENSVYFNYITENIELFMEDKYWYTAYHGFTGILFKIMENLIKCHTWIHEAYEHRFDSIINNDELLKKVIKVFIKRKMRLSGTVYGQHGYDINFDNQKEIEKFIYDIRNNNYRLTQGSGGSQQLEITINDDHGWKHEMRNSLADKFESVFRSIKDDEYESKKGDDFPSDGRKKNRSKKKSIKKKKSRRQRKISIR